MIIMQKNKDALKFFNIIKTVTAICWHSKVINFTGS